MRRIAEGFGGDLDIMTPDETHAHGSLPVMLQLIAICNWLQIYYKRFRFATSFA
ncbi:hypothetical protein ACVI1N_005163 [Sinorhizobium medicae]